MGGGARGVEHDEEGEDEEHREEGDRPLPVCLFSCLQYAACLLLVFLPVSAQRS